MQTQCRDQGLVQIWPADNYLANTPQDCSLSAKSMAQPLEQCSSTVLAGLTGKHKHRGFPGWQWCWMKCSQSCNTDSVQTFVNLALTIRFFACPLELSFQSLSRFGEKSVCGKLQTQQWLSCSVIPTKGVLPILLTKICDLIFAGIPFAIHANACWYELACIEIHANTFKLQLAYCGMYCQVESVFAHILNQYIHNTNTTHTNTESLQTSMY